MNQGRKRRPRPVGCKPSSVPARIGPMRAGEGHSSGPAIADGLSRLGSGLPAAVERRAGFPHGARWPQPDQPPLLGLAPGGVCPASDVTVAAVRSYRTFSPLPPRAEGPGRRYVFCGTFPIPPRPEGLRRDGGCYPPPRLGGARTFLPADARKQARQSGLPPTGLYDYTADSGRALRISAE